MLASFKQMGTSLVVQWLRLLTSNTGDKGSIPGQGTKKHMPHGVAKKKKKNKTQPTEELGWFHPANLNSF